MDSEQPSVRLFISHSSEDGELARQIVGLIRSALNLPAAHVRCTSVDGYRLPGGADTDTQLRQEIHDAEAFIGIVSEASLQSMYVQFELGGRWATKKHLLPLLAPGAPTSLLSGPLRGINALRADSHAQLHQLINDLARVLRLPPGHSAAYQHDIEHIVQTSPTPKRPRAAAIHRNSTNSVQAGVMGYHSPTALSESSRELLSEATRARDGAVIIARTHGGTAVSTNERQFAERGNVRSEAQWTAAVRELVSVGCLEDRRGKGEVFFVTDLGYRTADVIRPAK